MILVIKVWISMLGTVSLMILDHLKNNNNIGPVSNVGCENHTKKQAPWHWQ